MALWMGLAWAEPDRLAEIFTSSTLIWGPALWFLFVLLRFGNSRAMSRFYARAVTARGRAEVVLFGLAIVVTLAVGTISGASLLDGAGAPGLNAAVGAVALGFACAFVAIAFFGARPLAYGHGEVRQEGEIVAPVGTTIDRDLVRMASRDAILTTPRFPYRG